MRSLMPIVVLLVLVLNAGAAGAQNAPPAGLSDSWSKPASASTAAYGSNAAHREAAGGRDLFKFQDRRPQLPSAPSPGNNPIDKAPVSSGMPQIGPDGRPALNCMQSPTDPKCR